MIIYNITIKADLGVVNPLKSWIKEKLEAAKSNPNVKDAKIFRLTNVDTSDGITFCVQYYFEDMSAYNLYLVSEDVIFKREIMTQFKDKMFLFTSILSEE